MRYTHGTGATSTEAPPSGRTTSAGKVRTIIATPTKAAIRASCPERRRVTHPQAAQLMSAIPA